MGCCAPENSLGSIRDGQKAGWAEETRFKLRVKRSWVMGNREAELRFQCWKPLGGTRPIPGASEHAGRTRSQDFLQA